MSQNRDIHPTNKDPFVGTPDMGPQFPAGTTKRQSKALMAHCATLDEENGFERALIVALFQVESCAFPRLKIETSTPRTKTRSWGPRTWGTLFRADMSKRQSQAFMARCATRRA
jgi:hypothetical protein